MSGISSVEGKDPEKHLDVTPTQGKENRNGRFVQIHTVVHGLGLDPVFSWRNVDIYEATQQINKSSAFKLSSDLLNIVLQI